jgi:flagellar hook-basal body complex protein FliE
MSDFLINPNKYPAPVISSTPSEIKPAPLDSQGSSFGQMLTNAIDEVNQVQQQATEETQKLMTGEVKDIHTTMIAVQKADLSFQMMMAVRTKLVNAYQEIMRMPV